MRGKRLGGLEPLIGTLVRIVADAVEWDVHRARCNVARFDIIESWDRQLISDGAWFDVGWLPDSGWHAIEARLS